MDTDKKKSKKDKRESMDAAPAAAVAHGEDFSIKPETSAPKIDTSK